MLKNWQIPEVIRDYILTISLHESDILRQIREDTVKLPDARMQIPAEQGQFMAFLAQLINAKKIIEIGVFTGYSALWFALALPPEGRIIACDISEEWTNIAQRYWQQAGVANKIDLRVAPALQTLDALLSNSEAGTFDLIFLDADKENYLNYYERALQLIHAGGLIIIDNVLWSGRVIDHEYQDTETVALRLLNEKLYKDERIDITVLPIADGLTLIRKRS
ncbi:MULTISPECIES: class I SAM-dependent methyltransferase [unclassified Nostoc]|uniref:class I SAM-dependent methyltransferase n=1 Tax=unclassified Nostoc TaxID=2593658 RepID=UPI00260A969C|nr:class I SAM-dependent methyltransferase [Nostoc sp. S13]MDF5739436.1 class I SAM-dependent methyltransferase [Nostoc sp. S13]